jgi:hypothetical protein
MQTNGPGQNGPYHNGAPGTTQRDPAMQGDPFAQDYMSFDDDEQERESAEQQRPARKRRRLLVGSTIFLLVLAVAVASIWMMSGGGRKTKINVPVRETQQPDHAAARNNEDVTAQAIAEVRGATASATPALSASPVPAAPVAGAGTIIMPTTPVTVPIEGVGGTVSPAAGATTGEGGAPSRDAGAARREAPVSRRNPERSIRCAPIPTPVTKPIAGAPAKETVPEPASFKRAEPSIVVPSFGAMLPVRTLGALYTLRPSLSRFELARDMRGENWQLKKGTIIVGQQQGSEYDRAYVSLRGFIDPESKRLVRLTGEVLGGDGAQGLKGKRRRISSRWASVLNRAVTAGTALGQAAISRGNSTTVILPGAVAPELTSGLVAVNRREFVEVPAGTPGYLLITALPKESKGVSAEAVAEKENMNGDGALTDEELAALLESGSPEQIRAAMPRMSPELRQLAEMVLKESGR